MSTNEEKICEKLEAKMYEKAINGYQFQVERYNTWMNYYAIFVGTLFIALYTVWTGLDTCSFCECSCSTTTATIDNRHLILIITFLGWFASLCWYGALLGYRKWNEHWIGIVQDIERQMLENKAENLQVYGKQPQSKSQTEFFVAGYISTQKITGIFIFVVMVAWGVIFHWALFHVICNNFCWYVVLFFLESLILSIFFICFLHYIPCRFICSSIRK